MSRPLDTLLRPSLLAVAIAFAVPLASGPLLAAEQASSVRAYNLPAAPLASTLNQIASQAGLALSLNPSLASGKTSAPVQGQFDATGALREALRGTGLQLEQSSAGTYSLVAVPEGVIEVEHGAIFHLLARDHGNRAWQFDNRRIGLGAGRGAGGRVALGRAPRGFAEAGTDHTGFRQGHDAFRHRHQAVGAGAALFQLQAGAAQGLA